MGVEGQVSECAVGDLRDLSCKGLRIPVRLSSLLSGLFFLLLDVGLEANEAKILGNTEEGLEEGFGELGCADS